MKSDVRIKICGITHEKEAECLCAQQVDYAGFVFYEKSRRNMNVSDAVRIFPHLGSKIKKVAVVVSPAIEQIRQLESAGFDLIQVHGTMKEDLLEQIHIPIWKAINLTSIDDIEILSNTMRGAIEGYVLDAASYGSGHTFGWEKKENSAITAKIMCQMNVDVRKEKQFILAGGLHADNVQKGIQIFKPDIVDVSSGVEGVDGKDPGKIKAFVGKVRTMQQ